MIARLIRWSIANRFLVLLATLMVTRVGRVGDVAHAARRDSRSVRCAGDHPHHVSRAGAADRREPGHLSADHHDAVGAGRQDGARLFVLRRFVRLHPVRGRHRSVLGALARARIPEPGAVAPARAGQALARARRHGRGLGLRVRAGRPQRQDGPVAAARAAGLVPQVRAEGGAPMSPRSRASAAWCASTRSCSTPIGCARTTFRTRKVIDAVQKANQETGGSVLELGEAEYMVRASGYLQSLDDFRKIPLTTTEAGVAGAAGRRRARAGRPGNAPRHRRAGRRRRSRGRHHRHALGQERAGDDRRGQGEARAASRPACRPAWRSSRPTTAPA